MRLTSAISAAAMSEELGAAVNRASTLPEESRTFPMAPSDTVVAISGPFVVDAPDRANLQPSTSHSAHLTGEDSQSEDTTDTTPFTWSAGDTIERNEER